MKKRIVIIIGSMIALLTRVESLWALVILLFGNNDINKMDYPTSYWIGTIITMVVIFICVYWVLSKLEEYKRKIIILKKFKEKRIRNLITNIKSYFDSYDDYLDKIISGTNEISKRIVTENIKKNIKTYPKIEGEMKTNKTIKNLSNIIKEDFAELEEEYNKEFKNWEE